MENMKKDKNYYYMYGYCIILQFIFPHFFYLLNRKIYFRY